MNRETLEKLDVYNFLYTESSSNYDYRLGKSVQNNSERYISNLRVNPEEDDYNEFLAYCINNAKSVSSRTITMDYRLITDEMIEVLKDAYQRGNITGIRLYPEDAELTNELVSKFDREEFDGFLITGNNIEGRNTYFDVIDDKNVCKVERIIYNRNQCQNYSTSMHVTRKLTREEIHTLAGIINEHNITELTMDFYEPMYYRTFLSALAEEHINKDVEISFLANPLYDEASIYEGLDELIENNVVIRYNTCNDLNEYYRDEPYTTGANYYSDIEASGVTSVDNYTSMIRMFDEVIGTIEERGYSPLEKVAFIHDYFKKNYVYNQDHFLEARDENRKLDRVYSKDRMICVGFSNLYSALLRRSGVLCFTYGTDDHQKNIARITDEKYGVDNIVLIDPTWDLDNFNNRNIFQHFLVPIDNDLYAVDSEVISIPISLVTNNGTYSSYIEQSNPVYVTDPLGYAIRMLQLMGLGSGELKFDSFEDEVNFYKSALANSHLMDRMSDDAIIEAIHHVRVTEHEYTEEFEERFDTDEIEANITSRGNPHIINPRIKLFSGDEIETRYYIPKEGVHFVEIDNQNVRYHRPRKIRENESQEEYNTYLATFYHETFYERNTEPTHTETRETEVEESRNAEVVEPERVEPPVQSVVENVEEYLVIERIRIFRDTTNPDRLFAHRDIFERFHIEVPETEMQIPQRESIYELDPMFAYLLLNNGNNNYAPYEIEYEDIDILSLEEMTNQTIVEESDLIPGTNFRKPRERGIYETDEEYVAYLEYYYNSIFPETTPEREDEISLDDIIQEAPRPRGIYETDEEYTRYLQDFYGSVPKDELIPGTNFRKPRGRDIYETDEEYEAFLEKYYIEIYGEEVVENSKKKK